MRDLVAGRYRVPWEDQVAVVDGTSCGFPSPSRRYQPHPETAPGTPAVDSTLPETELRRRSA